MFVRGSLATSYIQPTLILIYTPIFHPLHGSSSAPSLGLPRSGRGGCAQHPTQRWDTPQFRDQASHFIQLSACLQSPPLMDMVGHTLDRSQRPPMQGADIHRSRQSTTTTATATATAKEENKTHTLVKNKTESPHPSCPQRRLAGSRS